MIPLYAKINALDPATGEEFSLESTEDFDFDQSLRVLSDTRRQELSTQLKRKTDASFVEAKRSVVSTQIKIPYWVGVALIILGWNEFMAILMNPLYLSLTLMLGVPFGILWYLDLLTVAQRVGWKAYDQAMEIGREKLRDVVHPGEPILVRAPQHLVHEEEDSQDKPRDLLHRHSARSLSNNGNRRGDAGDDAGEGLEMSAFENKKNL